MAVTEKFAFLERDLGFLVGNVVVHFRGCELEYAGRHYAVYLEYAPDTSWNACELQRTRPDGEVEVLSADDLPPPIEGGEMAVAMPKQALGRQESMAVLSRWADALRAVGPELVAGKLDSHTGWHAIF